MQLPKHKHGPMRKSTKPDLDQIIGASPCCYQKDYLTYPFTHSFHHKKRPHYANLLHSMSVSFGFYHKSLDLIYRVLPYNRSLLPLLSKLSRSYRSCFHLLGNVPGGCCSFVLSPMTDHDHWHFLPAHPVWFPDVQSILPPKSAAPLLKDVQNGLFTTSSGTWSSIAAAGVPVLLE